jgi:hypothetical protein
MIHFGRRTMFAWFLGVVPLNVHPLFLLLAAGSHRGSERRNEQEVRGEPVDIAGGDLGGSAGRWHHRELVLGP